MLTGFFQLDQTSSGEDFDLADRDDTDDASLQRDQSQPHGMDPLFNPTPSLRTKNTQGTDKSGQALDVNHFFIEFPVKDPEKRMCKLCA